ncbi:RNA polymerase sigma factor [Paenibacillus albicereus]|uniref:RNA polymerase sigma factor n=1 Tax=Paenibacillus albicereus TaxID=2726185 RepID=A0A6H2GV23_9BACL|nr:RNA polymerase sigma factor [Paenibacillus albicereus]QJC51274.1 RNA polymerase sigma factor [Paenibacillus albicereus]
MISLSGEGVRVIGKEGTAHSSAWGKGGKRKHVQPSGHAGAARPQGTELEEAGKKERLAEWMDEHGDAVFGYSLALTKSDALAGDVAQETFLKAYRHMDSYRQQAAVRTWLFAIARNTALSELRSAYFKRNRLFARVEDGKSAGSAEAAYLDAAAASELRQVVLELPFKLKEALLLELDHGLSLKEIGEALGLSVGTVKSRLSRARRKVESEWRRRNDEP